MTMKPGTNSGFYLCMGLAAGAFIGTLLQRRLAHPRQPEVLQIWQAALAKEHGEIEAAMLIARVRSQYEGLYASRPHFSNPVLRRQLEQAILPGLALYTVLRQRNRNAESAGEEVDRLFTAWMESTDRYRELKLLQRLPQDAAFNLVRVLNRLILKAKYPAGGAGWGVRWVEDNPARVAYDMTDCFYHKVLTAYGTTELTVHYCKVDDLLYGNLPGIKWERTKTLGRGDDCCNFGFSRMAAAEAETVTA